MPSSLPFKSCIHSSHQIFSSLVQANNILLCLGEAWRGGDIPHYDYQAFMVGACSGKFLLCSEDSASKRRRVAEERLSNRGEEVSGVQNGCDVMHQASPKIWRDVT